MGLKTYGVNREASRLAQCSVAAWPVSVNSFWRRRELTLEMGYDNAPTVLGDNQPRHRKRNNV
jgi:hypothetical protein